jgi:hypothetical protein
MPLQEHEVTRALDIARGLAHAGVPIFTAPPCLGAQCPHTVRARGELVSCSTVNGGQPVKAGFHLPANWENTAPNPQAVDGWRPGYALCAIGGHVCDFLDMDPRNGGQQSAEQLYQAGKWPNAYGQAATPSGGVHEIIQPLQVGKGEVAPGIDLQGGRPDGGGRGFVFIAPTVRASKVDGVARPYRWLHEPDMARLAEWRGEQSGAAIARLLPEHKAKKTPVPAADDDFYQAEIHTTISADRTIVGKHDEVVSAARRGWGEQFRTALNRAAFTLGAYVGSGYMTEEQASEHLCSAIRLGAGVEPDDFDLRWIEEGIRDGARLPIVVVSPSSPFARTAETGGDFGTRLIDAADLDQLEDPTPLIAGWLYNDTTARLVGQPGSYKSFVALDMACCVALGRPWHGRPVMQTPVLYVVGEGLAGYKKRVRAWCEINEVPQSELRGKLLLTRGSVQIGGEEWPALTEWVINNKAGLVVVDTQARATVGFEENSSSEQGVIIRHCDALRELAGGVMLLVHHTGHANGEAADRGRGSSAWRGAVDTELLLAKTGELTGALTCDRQKEAESGHSVSVNMIKVEWQLDGKMVGSLAVQIGDEAPLAPRSQWLIDRVAAGERFRSANELLAAARQMGFKFRNDQKADYMAEYHAAVAKHEGDHFDPNSTANAAPPVGANPFV